MFVELMLQRGPELFNVAGILRVTGAGDTSRIYLFGTPHPVEVREQFEDVKLKVMGALLDQVKETLDATAKTAFDLDVLTNEVKDDPEVP